MPKDDQIVKRERQEIETKEQSLALTVFTNWVKQMFGTTSALVTLPAMAMSIIALYTGKILGLSPVTWLTITIASVLIASLLSYWSLSKKIAKLENTKLLEIRNTSQQCVVSDWMNGKNEIGSSIKSTFRINIQIINYTEKPLLVAVNLLSIGTNWKREESREIDLKIEKGYNSFRENPFLISPNESDRITVIISFLCKTSFKEELGHYVKQIKGLEVNLQFKTVSPEYSSTVIPIEYDSEQINQQIEKQLSEALGHWYALRSKNNHREPVEPDFDKKIFQLLKAHWIEESDLFEIYSLND